MEPSADQVVDRLVGSGIGRGDLVGLAVAPRGALTPEGPVVAISAGADTGAIVGLSTLGGIEARLRPRWAEWSQDTARELIGAGTRLATCWDVAAVHRILAGGWAADPGRAWAAANGLDPDRIPGNAPPDLFSHLNVGAGDDPARPFTAAGYLQPQWISGGWAETPDRVARWAELARQAATRQQAVLTSIDGGSRAIGMARAESTTELLCAELAADGLPFDRSAAEAVIGELIGPRPASSAEAADLRAARDAQVLRHAPPGAPADLRSPLQIKALLASVGLDLPDTRAWRLEPLRDAHPLVGALLQWRKAERLATTYSYTWLDDHVGDDRRLRGQWASADGAAGRMTASAGLHNMPALLRPAVRADPGWALVRADLGQIEPRVLAAVSGDTALARAARADDLYAPVAAQLGVDRATAKVAVLGAMYGQTTGNGARALRQLRASYPVAMRYLDQADRSARQGEDLRTYGGRLIQMTPGPDDSPARVAARGRYGRNAMIQGAAAELFKMWAVTVRARGRAMGARIVLCLHDELLVHVPEESAAAAKELVEGCLDEAAGRWAPDGSVRFRADTSVARSWSEAKG